MLVNANAAQIQHTARTDMDPTTAAASALFSGLIHNPQASTHATAAAQAADNKASNTASSMVSSNVDAAFAKTRVLLQAAEPTTATPKTNNEHSYSQGSAVQEFREYMSKPVAVRVRDEILKSMGLTEEKLQSMSPERREAVETEIAQRMKEKSELQQVAKEQEKDKEQVPDKFLASN